MTSENVLRLRGLPWSASKSDIVSFFDPIPVAGGEEGVEIVMYNNGRPSGEAFVEIENPDDYTEAQKKHNAHLGSRYVEVFPVLESELPKKRNFADRDCVADDCIMRLRGLPFSCSKEEIEEFLDGYDIVSDGIVLPSDQQGRPTGEAFVQFIDKDTAERSLERHKEKIGHRYIEIFKSSELELRNANYREPRYGGGPMGGGFNSRPSPYDRSTGNHCVHMRGIPFRATFDDVCDFFRPVVPVSVVFTEDHSGRPSGEADVEFKNHEDAVRAMSKDKMNMQHRYIELFLNSSADGGSGSPRNSRRY